jgi:hypothetical protein
VEQSFEKWTPSGWKAVSEDQVREELDGNVPGLESIIVLITLSGEGGYFVQDVGERYRSCRSRRKEALAKSQKY